MVIFSWGVYNCDIQLGCLGGALQGLTSYYKWYIIENSMTTRDLYYFSGLSTDCTNATYTH